MTFAKPEKKNDAQPDESQKLLCTYPGCQNRWSIDLGRPMCSYHQWGNQKATTSSKSKQWYEDE